MRKLFIALAVLVGLCLPAASQTKSWYMAEDYGQWAIPSQFASTYVMQGANLCLESNGSTLFFPFKVSTPVLISDATPNLSEVVTPSAVTNTSGYCGITPTSTVSSHQSFYLKSGTAGLQEALNALGSGSLYPQVVYLTARWWQMAVNIPGTTPQAIIASASGSNAVTLIDLTTVPETNYAWNGSKYVPAGASSVLALANPTSYTGISAPVAPTTVAATCLTNLGGCITSTTTGGTIPANSAAYRVAYTYVDATGGETTISTDTAAGAVITPTGALSTSTISVTSPPAATGAVGWRLYMTAASGATLTEILYTPTCTGTQLQSVLNGVCAIGSTATISAIVTGTAKIPAIATAYPRGNGMQGSFPPFTALGTVASAATGTLGIVNFPAGYLNSLGRTLKVCGNGYATTNGTGGTITLATTLASIPGVTSITPFTAISPAIAGSVITVPFDFCVSYTTAAVGATGTLEAHGTVIYGVAGTVVGSPAMDFVITVSSTVDLTKQDQLAFTITPTTAGLSAAQLRQLTIQQLN